MDKNVAKEEVNKQQAEDQGRLKEMAKCSDLICGEVCHEI